MDIGRDPWPLPRSCGSYPLCTVRVGTYKFRWIPTRTIDNVKRYRDPPYESGYQINVPGAARLRTLSNLSITPRYLVCSQAGSELVRYHGFLFQ